MFYHKTHNFQYMTKPKIQGYNFYETTFLFSLLCKYSRYPIYQAKRCINTNKQDKPPIGGSLKEDTLDR